MKTQFTYTVENKNTYRDTSLDSKSLVFYNLNRTGSHAFWRCMDRSLKQNEFVVLREKWGERYQASEFEDLGKEPKILVGHTTFGVHEDLGLDAKYFTLLREPMQRFVSLYYHPQYGYREELKHLEGILEEGDHFNFQVYSLSRYTSVQKRHFKRFPVFPLSEVEIAYEKAIDNLNELFFL